MKIFIDTASLDEIKEINDMGILDGVTTNPTLMAKLGIRGEKAVADHYRQIATIYTAQHYTTQILAASIRSPNHIITCAALGAQVCTSPLQPILGLLKHPLTDTGLARFAADAEKSR